MNKTLVNIRVNQRNAPVLQRVEQIANSRPGSHQFTPTLIELLEIGLKSYEDGFRLVDEKVININQITTVMSVRREVGRSIFPKLVGILVDLKRYEKSKKDPNPKTIDFYQLAAKALFAQHAKFRHLTDNDVENVFKTIAPILKKCNLATDKAKEERIIKSHKQVLQDMINKTKVAL
ncbi:MAG: hypothetical protein K0R14_1322 [Burkholderiales bacterium]|jgi:hypothetical protein|nr:hypothetical protein [Burkholderiales bacterium]